MVSSHNDSETAIFGAYEPIIRRRFVSGEVSAGEFEREFLAYFKTDTNQVPGPGLDLLDRLFTAVDDCVDDPVLRVEVGGLDEERLRDPATDAYRRLY